MIKAKAHGKIILIGEHAVVHGYPAITIPYSKYITCKISESNDQGIRFIDKKFDLDEIWSFDKILAFKVKDKKKTDAIKVTIQQFYKTFNITSFPDIQIEVKSDLPIGGFGASTALVVSIFRALLKFFNYRIANEKLYKIGYIIESVFQSYASSGVDLAVIINKQPIWYQKSKPRNIIDPFKIDKSILNRFEIIDSGKPNENTGEVVNWVKKKLEKEPERIQNIFKNIEKYTYKLKTALENKDIKTVGELIDLSGEELIELGVVTPYAQKMIRKLQKEGKHAKMSGAGAMSGTGSGALLMIKKI